MRLAFESQNQLGRLCDETIYQADLAARLESAGLSPQTEVPVTITHRDFAKTYWLDLLVSNSAIYELKTVSSLAGVHEAQLLNYLFLCDAPRGKLVNFRPAQVEARYVNTSLTLAERRSFVFDSDRFQAHDQTDSAFGATLLALLQDWGNSLDLDLYTEAMVHFAGGEVPVSHLLPLTRDGLLLGRQRFHLLNPETAFRITALPDGASNHERHLRSLLRLTPLRAFHWANLARGRVQLVTLTH